MMCAVAKGPAGVTREGACRVSMVCVERRQSSMYFVAHIAGDPQGWKVVCILYLPCLCVEKLLIVHCVQVIHQIPHSIGGYSKLCTTVTAVTTLLDPVQGDVTPIDSIVTAATKHGQPVY